MTGERVPKWGKVLGRGRLTVKIGEEDAVVGEAVEMSNVSEEEGDGGSFRSDRRKVARESELLGEPVEGGGDIHHTLTNNFLALSPELLLAQLPMLHFLQTTTCKRRHVDDDDFLKKKLDLILRNSMAKRGITDHSVYIPVRTHCLKLET